MVKKRVVVCDPVDKSGLDILRQGVDEVIFLPGLPGRKLLDELEGTQAIMVRSKTKVTADIIEKARDLLVIAKHGVGYDAIDVEAATRKKIIVVNTPDANNESVAEHNLGLMIAISKNICRADRALRKGTFTTREDFIGTELKGRKMGIVGLGRTGTELVRKCHLAFDMKITCYDPYVPKEKAARLGYKQVDRLDELLKEPDYVVICVPLTKETTNLIGAKELALMRPEAFLINSSRGGIVDETALYNCLKEKKIAGAAMDVFAVEPPPSTTPLLSLENFIGTPHLAAITKDALVRMSSHAAEDIVRVLNGQRPKSAVNPEIFD